MAIPIRLINDHPAHQQDSGLKDMLNLVPSLLTDISPSIGLNKEAMASDRDAEVLFGLWEQSRILQEAESVSDRTYEVPSNFPSDDIMRLKTHGFISGDSKEIKFTERAAKVIRSMVLGENNHYQKQAIKKPYSLIMAESKPKRKSGNLAFASTNILNLADDYLIKNATGVHDKVYIVRIYKRPGIFGYDVIAFNGHYGNKLIPHAKGHYSDLPSAQWAAKTAADSKRAGGSS